MPNEREGWFLEDGWQAQACAWLVAELQRVARAAGERGGDVYLLTEP